MDRRFRSQWSRHCLQALALLAFWHRCQQVGTSAPGARCTAGSATSFCPRKFILPPRGRSCDARPGWRGGDDSASGSTACGTAGAASTSGGSASRSAATSAPSATGAELRIDLRGRGAHSDRRLHRGRLTLQLAGADAATRSAAGSRNRRRACPGPDAARRHRRDHTHGRADRPPASRRRDARPGRGRRSQRERPTSTISSRPFVAAFPTMTSATAINRAEMGMPSPPALVG
jgi:hypothetical protein